MPQTAIFGPFLATMFLTFVVWFMAVHAALSHLGS